MRYFHGGVPGLRPGDLVTPHPPRVLDGCPVCAARAVEPVGEPEPSDEDPFPSWCIPEARVVSVYDRAVQLNPGQRNRLMRRWAEADREASR